MRMTFVTPQPPEQYGGGGMLVYAHLLALSHILGSDNVLYFGPESKTIDINKLAKQAYYVEKTSNIQKLKAVVYQRDYTTMGIYFDENKQQIMECIKKFSPYVWVEFTKTGYLVENLRRQGCTIICYAHNYEHDYYKISEKKMYNIFRKAIVTNEKLSCDNSTTILGDDSYLEQMKKIYKNNSTYSSLPFFSHKTEIHVTFQNTTNFEYLILSGSFAYGHNLIALKQILEYWNTAKNSTIHLGICGSGMDAVKPYLTTIPNLIIFNKPFDEHPIIKNSKLYLNPFISNTGVLTRNLVSMSAGTPIVGLVDSFKGYGLENRKEVIMCDNIVEIIQKSLQVAQDVKLMESLRSNIANTFNNNYSFSTGKKKIEFILEKLTKL